MTARHVTLPLDHVGWLVQDLAVAATAFAELGFAATRPGILKTGSADSTAVDVGQRSAHVMFADTYLELTALASGAGPEHLQPYLDRSGLIILALRVDSAAIAHQALQRTSLTVTAVSRSERPVAYDAPARQGMAAFHWFMCVPAEFPEMLVCCVEHLTPELLFQPDVYEHDNGARALRSVFVLEPDPSAASSRFTTLAGAVAADAESLDGSLILLSAGAAASRFPGIDLGGNHAHGIGVGLKVADLDVLARRLTDAGVRWTQHGDRIWCAGPAGGVLEFQA